MADSDQSMSLRDLIPSWELTMRAKNRSQNTRKLYVRGVEAFLQWCEAKDVAPTFERALIQAYVAESLESRTRSASTVRDYLKGLKMFARWCVAEEEVDREDVSSIEQPQVGTTIRPLIALEYHEAMLATCDLKTFAGKRDAAILRLMRDAGPRASEIMGLRLDDVVITKGFAVVRGKGGKDRFIAFGTETTLALDRYLRTRRNHRQAGSPALWLGAKSNSFNTAGLRHMIDRRAAQAGVPHATSHMWRRLWAHSWLDQGGSRDGLKALAGWSTDAMVHHYTEQFAMDRALKEARKLFGQQ